MLSSMRTMSMAVPPDGRVSRAGPHRAGLESIPSYLRAPVFRMAPARRPGRPAAIPVVTSVDGGDLRLWGPPASRSTSKDGATPVLRNSRGHRSRHLMRDRLRRESCRCWGRWRHTVWRHCAIASGSANPCLRAARQCPRSLSSHRAPSGPTYAGRRERGEHEACVDCLLDDLLKTGGRLIRHARYFTLQLAESYLTGALFRQILRRIERLAWHP